MEPFGALIELSVAEDLEPRVRSASANDDQATITELLKQEGMLMGLSGASTARPALRRLPPHRPARQLGARARGDDLEPRRAQAHG